LRSQIGQRRDLTDELAARGTDARQCAAYDTRNRLDDVTGAIGRAHRTGL
jgi:hypothetical protein